MHRYAPASSGANAGRSRSRIAPELLAQVDVIAQRMGQSRAAFINLAIYRAVQGEDAASAR